jgi:hypothetical protein
MTVSVRWMLILEAKNDRSKEQLVASVLAQASGDNHMSAEELHTLLETSPGELESRAASAMVAGYESALLGPGTEAAFDGYRDHTPEDMAFRASHR